MGCGACTIKDHKQSQNTNSIISKIIHKLFNDDYSDSITNSRNTSRKYFFNSQDKIFFNKGKLQDFYYLNNQIGVGSFGKVYKALHLKTNQHRAVKSIKIKSTIEANNNDPEDVYLNSQECINSSNQRQAKEIPFEVYILSLLDHPNIVKLFEYFIDSHYLYIVMELVEGVELFDYIKSKKFLSEKESAYIFKQILSSISYMHDKSIVHRDIKPENVILCPIEFSSQEVVRFGNNVKLHDENKSKVSDIINNKNTKTEKFNYIVKLIDLGSGAIFNSKASKKSKSSLTKICGSCYYVAPEVIKKKYNEKCDIWSAGILLYVMIGGILPFRGKAEQEVFDDIIEKSKNAKLSNEGLTNVVNFKCSPRWENEVSLETKRFITSFLIVDQDKRPSVYQYLLNDWFDKLLSDETVRKNDSCILNINTLFNRLENAINIPLIEGLNKMFDDKNYKDNNSLNNTNDLKNDKKRTLTFEKNEDKYSSKNNYIKETNPSTSKAFNEKSSKKSSKSKNLQKVNKVQSEDLNNNGNNIIMDSYERESIKEVIHNKIALVDINVNTQNNKEFNPYLNLTISLQCNLENSKDSKNTDNMLKCFSSQGIVFDIVISLLIRHYSFYYMAIAREFCLFIHHSMDFDKNGKITLSELSLFYNELKSGLNSIQKYKNYHQSVFEELFNGLYNKQKEFKNEILISNELAKENNYKLDENKFSISKQKNIENLFNNVTKSRSANLQYEDLCEEMFKLISSTEILMPSEFVLKKDSLKLIEEFNQKFNSSLFNDESLLLIFQILDYENKGYITKKDILSIVEINTEHSSFIERFGKKEIASNKVRNSLSIQDTHLDFLYHDGKYEDIIDKGELDYIFTSIEIDLFAKNVFMLKFSEFKKYIYGIVYKNSEIRE